MKLNPLHDRVVVRRVEADTKTSTGIIIPDNVAEKPDQGIVLAVGAGKRTSEGTLIPMSLKENDKVLFGKFAGQTVKIKGEEMLILKEEEIYAVIEEQGE
jgi:chaperonin GroES